MINHLPRKVGYTSTPKSQVRQAGASVGAGEEEHYFERLRYERKYLALPSYLGLLTTKSFSRFVQCFVIACSDYIKVKITVLAMHKLYELSWSSYLSPNFYALRSRFNLTIIIWNFNL